MIMRHFPSENISSAQFQRGTYEYIIISLTRVLSRILEKKNSTIKMNDIKACN